MAAGSINCAQGPGNLRLWDSPVLSVWGVSRLASKKMEALFRSPGTGLRHGLAWGHVGFFCFVCFVLFWADFRPLKRGNGVSEKWPERATPAASWNSYPCGRWATEGAEESALRCLSAVCGSGRFPAGPCSQWLGAALSLLGYICTRTEGLSEPLERSWSRGALESLRGGIGDSSELSTAAILKSNSLGGAGNVEGPQSFRYSLLVT